MKPNDLGKFTTSQEPPFNCLPVVKDREMFLGDYSLKI